ncbi:hypothetical protein ACK36M_07865 [Aeromonas veronii]
MAVYPVKWFHSSMQGAPSLGDTTEGALTALIKAVLVTGFGQLQATSITFDPATGWAKANFQSGHKYLQDSVIHVEGVTPVAYNGEHRVMQVDSNNVWFEIDGGNPGSPGTGTMMVKVAPLGWTITHESPDGKIFIVRPTDVSASGNISLRIDNSAYTGWAANNQWLAKVAMVEDVIDINTFTTAFAWAWPCTGRFGDKRWDLVGDSQMFYFIPAYGATGGRSLLYFGYIKTVRPGDRYHAALAFYPDNGTGNTSRQWQDGWNMSMYYNILPVNGNNGYKQLARPYHQMFGSIAFQTLGIFSVWGSGLPFPNPADNAFYVSADPLLVMEAAGSVLRGSMPGIVMPFTTQASLINRNYRNLPAIPGKIVRFLDATRTETMVGQFGGQPLAMFGFDLTGPWR